VNPALLSILSDQPAAEDQLNFAPYAKTLADIISTLSEAVRLDLDRLEARLYDDQPGLY
jgi:hypothetical protein